MRFRFLWRPAVFLTQLFVARNDHSSLGEVADPLRISCTVRYLSLSRPKALTNPPQELFSLNDSCENLRIAYVEVLFPAYWRCLFGCTSHSDILEMTDVNERIRIHCEQHCARYDRNYRRQNLRHWTGSNLNLNLSIRERGCRKEQRAVEYR